MADILDRSVELPIPCGNCGQEMKETIRRIEDNPDLTCPNCGAVTHLNADQFKAKLAETEEFIRNLGRKFDKS